MYFLQIKNLSHQYFDQRLTDTELLINMNDWFVIAQQDRDQKIFRHVWCQSKHKRFGLV